MKPIYVKVQIRFSDHHDHFTFAKVDDDVTIDCGDFSEERLAALHADVKRRIARAWEYMREREVVEEEGSLGS